MHGGKTIRLQMSTERYRYHSIIPIEFLSLFTFYITYLLNVANSGIDFTRDM